jgi:hypothetical protein
MKDFTWIQCSHTNTTRVLSKHELLCFLESEDSNSIFTSYFKQTDVLSVVSLDSTYVALVYLLYNIVFVCGISTEVFSTGWNWRTSYKEVKLYRNTWIYYKRHKAYWLLCLLLPFVLIQENHLYSPNSLPYRLPNIPIERNNNSTLTCMCLTIAIDVVVSYID